MGVWKAQNSDTVLRQVLGYAPEAPGPLPPALYRLLDPNLSVDLPPAHKVQSALVHIK